MRKSANAFLLLFLIVMPGCHQKPDTMIIKLDETLKLKNTYESYFKDRMKILKRVLSDQKDPDQIYKLNKRLAEEYMAYSLDSTTKYLSANELIAQKEGDSYKKAETDLCLAEEYAMAGYHIEASEILHRYSSETIPTSLKKHYFEDWHALSGELMAYASNGSIYNEKLSDRDMYRDSLLSMTDSLSFDWLNLKREAAESVRNTDTAREYANEMINISAENSHDYAKACYFYSLYLTDRDQSGQRLEWLAKSAMADVLCATKDYAALNDIAKVLFENGDIDRAFRYAADNCMQDALFFNGKLRPWQISQFFPRIEKAYELKSRSQEDVMHIFFLILTLMLFLLAFMFANIYSRKKVLERVNSKLKALNSQFQEANKVKQEYIALFLGILSENINTTRQYKNHVLKYLRRGNDKYLVDEIETLPSIDDDIRRFYEMFDKTFINLYPNFVERFNSLLADGESVVPKNGEILTPELRIFALIKLGITDSSKIASLLHYSANTIYNYRAKIKNKAKGDRDKFENDVKAID
jgi:DNA-binding CsgD family transcriptional regulator